MNTEVDAARISDDPHGEHPTLFPLADVSGSRPSPRSVCDAIGLNWLAARRLSEAGWLSFDPQSVSSLTIVQEAELRFLGAIVTTGCDESLLRKLLSDLRRPYAYRLDRMYYDWRDQCWRLLPREDEFRERFDRWLDDLVDRGEVARLESLEHSIQDAMRSLRSALPW